MATEKFTIDDTISQIKSTFDTLDTRRATGLETVLLMQQVNADAQNKELARLVKKYGDQHPKVKKIQARQIYDHAMFAGLKIEIDRSKIKTPPFEAGNWRVNGQVYDKDIHPIKQLTVYLTDAKGKRSETLGFSCTDDVGYYSITAKDITKYSEQVFFLTVSDAKKKIIFQSKEVLKMTDPTIIYRDIIIEDKKDCESPF